MASISDKTISKLFGLAAGRCSMCKEEVVERNVKIGEMAHIIAKRKGGARGALPVNGDINGYDNLILLCPNDHTRVDNDEDRYPPEVLHRIKNEHEAYVRQRFDHQSQGRAMDVGGLKALMLYLPFTQLIYLTQSLPERFNHKLHFFSETFENFALDNPQCRPFSDSFLEGHYVNFANSMVNLIDYEQHGAINRKNVYLPGSVIGGDFNTSYLNRDLDGVERQKAHAKVNLLLRSLAESYHPLLQYLKVNYPEVHLASFVG